jgi:AbrB family looped-hinge helix DNA binding protein
MRELAMRFGLGISTGVGAMQEFRTKVTSNGRITVPVEVRRSLGLKAGDKVAVSMSEPGSRVAILRPATAAMEGDLSGGALHDDPADNDDHRGDAD